MIEKIKDEYWDLIKYLRIDDYINPINIIEQRQVFEEKYRASIKYNPVFDYEQPSFCQKDVKNQLCRIRREFIDSNDVYRDFYIKKINLDISYVGHIFNRKVHDSDFAEWLTSLFGIPDKYVLEKAYSLLSDVLPENQKNEEVLSSSDLVKIFQEEIDGYGFSGWKISVEEIPAEVSINPVLRHIKIKKSAVFSRGLVDRLIAHEISVHVLRNENGRRQGDSFYSYGFPEYLQTEEGLAIVSEMKSGLLLDGDLMRYASRLIASYYCIQEDFFDLFLRIKKYHSFEEAFSIVARVKRGLITTADYGGYTKDQVYLSGYFQVKECEDDVLQLLFCGKIGLNDISFVKKNSMLDLNYPTPKWLKCSK